MSDEYTPMDTLATLLAIVLVMATVGAGAGLAYRLFVIVGGLG
jgi:hypothetical protein